MKYIALAYLILDMIGLAGASNAGGHLSHLGGAALGWYFASRLRNGHDITAGFSRLVDRIGGLFEKRSKMNVSYRRPMSDIEYDMDYNARKIKKQAELDRILEKVKRSGYDSLTKSEKKTLFDASKN
jgi:hypothetical protein